MDIDDNYDYDSYDQDGDDYGQPIIYISAHGSVILDSHPDFENLSSPQNTDYMDTPVFWLTEFGTVLRAHNYDSGATRMMYDSIEFVYNKNLKDVDSLYRTDLLSAWKGKINNRDYTKKLGLSLMIEPTIPRVLQDRVSGVQRYSLHSRELTERKVFDNNKYDENGHPWGVWIYNRTTKEWDPVERFQEDIDYAINNRFKEKGADVVDFTLDDVFWHVEEEYGARPIVFSYSCRHLELPDNGLNYDNYLVSERTMNASIQRRLEENRMDELEHLYNTYIVLTNGLLENIIQSMLDSDEEYDFNVDLTHYIGHGYKMPSNKKINEYIQMHYNYQGDYGGIIRKALAGEKTRRSKQSRSKQSRSKQGRSKQGRSKQSRSKRSRSKQSIVKMDWNKLKWDEAERDKHTNKGGIKKRIFTRADFKNYLKAKKRRDDKYMKNKRVAKGVKPRGNKIRKTRRRSKKLR